jgi:hypothetical protein
MSTVSPIHSTLICYKCFQYWVVGAGEIIFALTPQSFYSTCDNAFALICDHSTVSCHCVVLRSAVWDSDADWLGLVWIRPIEVTLLSDCLSICLFHSLRCILILSNLLFIQPNAQLECSKKMLKLTLKIALKYSYMFRLNNHHDGAHCCVLLKL